MKDNFDDEFQIVYTFYKDDFKYDRLSAQLLTLGEKFSKAPCLKTITIFEVQKHLLSLSKAQQDQLVQVVKLLKLVLVMPSTNAASERSFSAHCKELSILSTMNQDQLNHTMLLHVHKDRLDGLDLLEIAHEFFSSSEYRLKLFGEFH